MKNAIDVFALGHSTAKTLLALVFFLAVQLAQPIAHKIPRSIGVALGASLALCAVVSLVEYLWFCHRFSLYPPAWSAMVRDGLWSLDRLDHIHTSKVLLAPLFGHLAAVTDAGYPFLPVFSAPVVLAHSALFVLVVLLAFLGCARSYSTSSAGRATSVSLAVFVLLKNVVDGGPLNPEVWAAMPVLLILIWPRRGLGLSVGLLVLYVASLPFWVERPLGYVVFNLVGAALAMAAPWLWESWTTSKEKKVALFVLGGALVYLSPLVLQQLDSSLRWAPNGLVLLRYGWSPLKAGQKVWITTSRPEELLVSSLFTVRRQARAGTFTSVEVTLLDPSTPLALCEQLGLPISRRPVSWYQGEMEAEILITAVDGALHPELDNPLVLSAKVEKRGSDDFLRLRLAPGVDQNIAIQLMGPGLAIIKSLRFERAGSRREHGATSLGD